jgi:signal transduction histidine kinase
MRSQDNPDQGRDASPPLFSEASLLTALPFALCAVDRELRIVYANAAWDRFIGAPEDGTMRGFSLPGHLREPERSRWEGIARDILAGKNGDPAGSTHILEIASADGGKRSLRILVTPIRYGEGPPAGVLFTGYETADAEMTAQQRQAEDAARLQVARQLAATLNHEINNPLFIISATLEDLLAETADPALERMLRASLDAVWQVSAAVKQLSEIRQIVTTAYIAGYPMIDLEKSQERPEA